MSGDILPPELETVLERPIKTVGATPDGWAINKYADEDVPRRCFYCEHAERLECPTCVDRSEFKATEEAMTRWA